MNTLKRKLFLGSVVLAMDAVLYQMLEPELFLKINVAFLLNILIGGYITYDPNMFTINPANLTMYCAGLIMPTVEESLFRCTTLQLIGHWSYYRLINSLLFGMMHSINYIVLRNIKGVVYQCLMASMLRYLLDDTQGIGTAIVLHTLYNCMSIMGVFIIWYRYQEKKTMADVLSEFSFGRSYERIPRRRSLNDLDELEKTNSPDYFKKRDFVGEKDMNSGVMDSISRFDKGVSELKCRASNRGRAEFEKDTGKETLVVLE